MFGYQSANILLHVIFISAFLAIFFFTYASKIETTVVKKQSESIVSDIVSDVAILLPQETIFEINSTILPRMSPPDMRSADAEVNAQNNALIKKVSVLIVCTVVIGLAITYFITRVFGPKSDPPFTFSSIIIHNLIILTFVGLTEFVFLYFFVQNYTSIDSNYVKYKIFDTIDKRLEQKN